MRGISVFAAIGQRYIRPLFELFLESYAAKGMDSKDPRAAAQNLLIA
jgi:hypothetical protein